MTRSSTPHSTMNYGELLLAYKPRVIDSDREHARALKKIDALMRKRKRTAAEDKLLDLLVTLVERYDEQHYPVGQSSPARMLAFLMSQQSLEQRIVQLEREVAELKRQTANGQSVHQPGPDDWKKTVGMFRGDPVFQEMIDEAARVREAEREQIRTAVDVKDWESTIGTFDGDPVIKEIIDETLKIREEDRERTRP